MSTKFAGFVVVLALVVAGLGFFRPLQVSVTSNPVVGASSGTEHTNLQNFYAGVRVGNAKYAPLLNVVATTTSWNPGTVFKGSSTSTEVSVSSTVTGFTRGQCGVSLNLVSSTGLGDQLFTGCYFSTSTAVISLFAPASSTSNLDIGTSTVTIWQLQF